MPQSIVYKFVGPTVGITVSTSPSGQVTVNPAQGLNDQVNYCAWLNVGPTIAAVSLGNGPGGAVAPAFPLTTVTAVNVSATIFVLPPAMQQPMVVACPVAPFNFSAVTNSSVGPVIYATPVVST